MSSRICPECGQELPAGAPAGMCPNCLLQLGFAAARKNAQGGDAERPDSSSLFSRSFGDYELLDEVARGGMCSTNF